ncbi:MAG: bifunctional diaminohydroxyphosphoribosylaminopyrimidine deaminase/5-amino-6-(5-phosphoribosylamino)uracil reductase RibD [Longimicrobiales bacterium]
MTGSDASRERPTPSVLGWDDLDQGDVKHLRRAIELGRRGWGSVHPNPMVGCVLVRDGQVIAEAFHEVYGEAHAEARALASVEGPCQGVSAYVSLEPCAHFGKTPPCARALKAAGVSKVVFWARDPGPESGGGASWLRQQGVVVQGPVEGPQAWAAENPFFFHQGSPDLPFVAVKLAVSLDDGIAPQPGVQHWLTGPESRAEVHRIRAGFDAILVGARTWAADDPRLTVRTESGPHRDLVRVLLDGQADLQLSARVFQEGDAPVWVLTSPENEQELVDRLEGRATVLPVASGPNGLETRELLKVLRVRGLRTVLCEGGGQLAASMLAENLVRRFYHFRAPVVLGDGRVPAFPGGESPVLGESAVAREGWIPVGQPRRYGGDMLTILDRGN